jgi:hypothetical protein
VAYEEEGARVHGLDGAYLQHQLSRRPLAILKDFRLTQKCFVSMNSR